MSHEIPEPYCWDESFKTFYDKIDNEHKILFQGIFNVAAGRGDAGTLKNLIDNVEFHFNEEQGLMEKANYSEFPAHKQLHVDFIAKLKGISCPVSDDSVHFAKEWLVNHIKDTDFKYKGKLDTLDELEQLHISNDE